MKRILAIAVTAALCAFTHPPKELQLRYVFKKGDTFEWSQAVMQTQNIAVAGQEIKNEIGMKGAMLMKTLEANGNSAKFEIEYASISMNVKSQQGDVAMDSEGDTTSALNKMARKMKGKKFTFTLSKFGIVESVENIENVWSAVGNVADPVAAQMKSQLEKSLGKVAFKRSIESSLAYYTDQKVQAGSTWKQKVSGINDVLPLQADNVWTLESVTEPTAVVVSDGVISTTDTTKVIPMMGAFKATANLKGRQVTKITVSTAHGWPQTCKLYSELKGKMMLLAGGQIPEDMPMQMESTTEAEYVLKKK
ncbi:MAG TPA: DUF6263 family protein [Cyclobacteriaceae bacterium]|jgi:hypothetical protein|nr:DUF6263 family protein [Cyclobacteriaceae bacterium]